MRTISRGLLLGVIWLAGVAVAQTNASDSSRVRTGSNRLVAESKSKVVRKAAAPSATWGDAQAGLPALPPELTAVSEQVHLGQLSCELGQYVVLTTDEKSPGRFYMHFKRQTFHLTPVSSQTGAIRLEDEKQGAVWIQLSNKSMLMNSKLGQRLADECQSPAQMAVAQAMKFAPPVHLLEGGRDVARQ